MARFATIDKGKSMSAILKVVGVGGGGCNAIESMITRGLIGVEYVAVNTDAQVLNSSSATHRIQVGTAITGVWEPVPIPMSGKNPWKKIEKKLPKSFLVVIWFLLPLVWAEELVLVELLLLLLLLKA